MKLQHNQTCIFLLIFILQKQIIGQVIVDMKYGFCDCEELETDYECLINSKCKFENGKCKPLPCESLSDPDRSGICIFAKNQGCVFDYQEETCTDFKGCSFYNFKSHHECSFYLPSNCYYDSELQRCEDQSQLPNCSELLLSQCFHGKEGLCVVKDGKCQEFTKCEDVAGNDIRCIEAGLACQTSENYPCENMIGGCQYATQTTCFEASVRINSYESYLCKEKTPLQLDCIDWDPANETLETCLIESFGTHHWKNNKCEKCQPGKPNTSIQLEIAIILLSLTF
ncbi:unnamed protein product (macronuclear) [Paramecium tetraurelia]|uniref:Chitin-binding type-2 domain-containing protein n=1 Tax=Paramecium tetraurelia TaxID=5888 RepID=A0D510_PARTE|nr:uncharacterized protein GSPATT00013574001 [Paramecium tetraurelia]CAK78127.1 unnamed protein product [Paramecium tetraurelia]|eukprot:XP_001445524.1 hypothetical protein (macronuclear) [Paramecium tetraurelia strain d4-2]